MEKPQGQVDADFYIWQDEDDVPEICGVRARTSDLPEKSS